MTRIRYDITFVGRVQGVFFRATAADVARGFDIDGWVRNEANGTVRCVVEGEAASLDGFVAALETAKQGNIDETVIRRLEATGEFAGFVVRR